jgi:hypothetical protein
MSQTELDKRCDKMSHDASRLDSLASLARIDRGTRPVTKLELSCMFNSLDKKRSLYIVYNI